MESPHPSIPGFEMLQVELAADGSLDILIADATQAEAPSAAAGWPGPQHLGFKR